MLSAAVCTICRAPTIHPPLCATCTILEDERLGLRRPVWGQPRDAEVRPRDADDLMDERSGCAGCGDALYHYLDRRDHRVLWVAAMRSGRHYHRAVAW